MLKLSIDAFEKIRNHGEQAFPDECCGVLFGKTNGKERYVIDVLEIHNSFDPAEKYHRFLITPDNYRSAEKTAREKGLDIFGFYHSHPNAPSAASKYDLDHAFPWFSYLIVSVMKGKFYDIHSWIMEDDRSIFREENVIIDQSITA